MASDLDVMAEHLEELFVGAIPRARAESLRGADHAMWIGGDSGVAGADAGWRDQVEAVCAVMGLRAEIIEEPGRRVRTVETALTTRHTGTNQA